jgi:hypothetical protein
MANMDNTNQKLELLKMARQLLNEEYINRRAEDHNAWLANCDEAWRTRRIKLPYPPFAPYPTEEQIVAKALTLYTFVNPDEGKNKNDTNEQPKPNDTVINTAPPKVHKVTTPWTLYQDNDINRTIQPEVQPMPVVVDKQEVNSEPVKDNTVTENDSTTPSSINETMKSLLPNFWRSKQDKDTKENT